MDGQQGESIEQFRGDANRPVLVTPQPLPGLFGADAPENKKTSRLAWSRVLKVAPGGKSVGGDGGSLRNSLDHLGGRSDEHECAVICKLDI